LILSGWLSSGRHARVVCDGQQKVLWQNDKFETLASRTGRVVITYDRLNFANKNDQALVTDFIASSDKDDFAFWVNDKEGHPVISVQCQRISAIPGIQFFGFRLALNDDNLSADHKGFEAYFNLTRQEAIICRLMIQGKTVPEIVQIYGKSQDTIRFHVRNIYRKMNISSREELFAALRHFHFL
jgi:DNA-binding CsgD family transcriptional regulator